MRKNYSLKRLYIFLGFLVFLSFSSQAQCPAPSNSVRLDVNNIDALFKTRGSHFFVETAEFVVPKGGGKSTIFAASLWLAGMDEQDSLHVAAMRFGQVGHDFWAGPVSNAGAEAGIYYDRFWKVSKAEIEYHKLHYGEPAYRMPESIANWPAHGRAEYGESAHLAPYKNVSGNSSYTPSAGDYPLIRGDQAIFWINNDACDLHTESGGAAFGVEILSMAYAYDSPDSMLQNTIFLSYILRNKSTNNYRDFYLGFWTDFDIGYSDDDYVGCDTSLNLMYGYNGREIDGRGQAHAYGANPPAQGVMFLNQQISAFVSHNNNQTPVGDPTIAQYYYNFLRAIWIDNEHVRYGGSGHPRVSPTSNGEETNFMYSGDPVTGTGWTEESAGNPPGDRRGVMSVGPLMLLAGESISIDLALPFARSFGSNSALGSVALLKQRAREVQEYYDEHITGIKENKTDKGKILVYPNPSNGQFTVACEKVIESIELYDILGKKVFVNTPKTQTTQVNIHLPNGLYIYRVLLNDNSTRSGKMIVQ